MNFGKLLGAGKSFFGGCKTAEYRQNKQVYLPKFNVKPNPSAPKTLETAKPVAGKVSEPEAASARKTPALSAARPVRAGGWTIRLNPFRAPEPAAPPLANAVQAELSLDAVKVLHNDLSDADVEVVPVKSRSAAPPPSTGLFGGQQLNSV